MTASEGDRPHPVTPREGFVLDSTQVARLPGDAPTAAVAWVDATPLADTAPQDLPSEVLPLTPLVHEARPRRSGQGLVAAVFVALCATLGGGLAWVASANEPPPAPTTFDLRGTFTLYDDDFDAHAQGCAGNGGYTDIATGTPVTIYDGDEVLAAGVLGKGHEGDGECEFAFTVRGVPIGVRTMGVEVSHRGKITFSEQDARAGNVHLELGNS
ncbi:hypothetical protein [Actinokineospora terrae]|uniref:Uncharacterized protein n=1 Tax=Actinokineospora terrae TaxID=155974 RepID=A0A1H9Q194_9PSEU|nr:hypothetical protein [Actinokineospora terrae]SER54366.1 hypothetical protein SAMN04487818_10451 [Actinokineospora terrae]